MSKNRPLGDHIARFAVRSLGALPTSAKRLLAGKPIVVDGQQLNVEAQVGMRLLNLAVSETFEALPLDKGREQIDGEAWVFGAEHPVETVRDITIPGPEGDLPARLYRPAGIEGPSAALVYFHGGGWVLGNLGSGDSVSRFLAAEAGITVISVDYRLAPEHPFPAAFHDGLAAFTHVAENAAVYDIDPKRIAIGGESAGGNLTAVISNAAAHRAQSDATAPVPAFQMMFMPVTDLTVKRRSYELFSDGFFLTSAQMDWYKNHYLSDPEEASDPRVSPILETDLVGVAPAYVAVAGFDVLRDEGEAYAAKLAEAGVSVALRRHSGLTHGLINATGVGNAARDALLEAAGALRVGLRVCAVPTADAVLDVSAVEATGLADQPTA